jgi:hypothetical protein
VSLTGEEANARLRTHLRAALAPGVSDPPEALVWADAGDELVLHAGAARAECGDGVVVVVVPVATEQTGEAEVRVPFAVGGPGDRPGLVLAAETRAAGPRAVVDRWDGAIIAAAWDALVRLAVEATAPALPAGLAASPGGLAVLAGPVAAAAPVETR